MERTRVPLDRVVVTFAVVVTILAVAGYGLLRPAAVPAGASPSIGPPVVPPNDGGPGGTATWPPLGNGSSALAPPVNVTYDLRLSATTDRAVYAPGQVVQVNVTIENIGNTAENLTFFGCWFSFSAESAPGAVVYDSIHHQTCIFAITEVSLPPGGSLFNVFSWGQVADNGTAVPASATYTMVPRLLGGNEDPVWVVATTILVTGLG